MQRGQVTLELIAVIPCLCLLLWGMWEMALSIGDAFLARYAAYAAARLAVVAEPDARVGKAENKARQILSLTVGRRVNPLSLAVNCSQEGDDFEVAVSWRRKRIWQGLERISGSSKLPIEE